MAMVKQIVIGLAAADDLDTLAGVTFEAIRCGRIDYPPEQRRAWVLQRWHGKKCIERLASQSIYAVLKLSDIVVFMRLTIRRYINLASVHPR
jgi:hypothetical protein